MCVCVWGLLAQVTKTSYPGICNVTRLPHPVEYVMGDQRVSVSIHSRVSSGVNQETITTTATTLLAAQVGFNQKQVSQSPPEKEQ